MKMLILNNVAAGFANTDIFDFIRSVARADDEIVLRTLDTHSNFADAVVDCKCFDCLVIAGGDGTHSSLCYLTRYSGVPTLLYPSGTANLMTMNLESPEEPPALASMVHSARTLDFDLGQILVANRSLGFMMIAGCGYDATIMREAQQDKQRLGPIAYFKAAFENAEPQQSHFKLTIDGNTVEEDGVGVLFLNFSKIQFDIRLGKENRPRDGMLDVLILATHNAWELLPPALGLAIDKSGAIFDQSNLFKVYRGKRIEVEADPPLKLQFDGEPSEYTTPFVAEVLPGATKLYVCDDGYNQFYES